ncbi:unnamed protein product [Amoebophrya sp. A25]|nr:unnamed protein product [Amoebophrya sp. A25]|eukprot:GSA25T00005391001.1
MSLIVAWWFVVIRYLIMPLTLRSLKWSVLHSSPGGIFTFSTGYSLLFKVFIFVTLPPLL